MAAPHESLLALLKEQGIEFQQFSHPPVSSPEEQAKYINTSDQSTKSLVLKDKKNRMFLICCKASTKLDLKVLAQRLGVGKGGLRFAPEEIIQDLLKVPSVCASPFALTKESQSSVTLLLDAQLKTANGLLFHPLSNELTIAVSPSSLDHFLESIGKTPAYVDLEAVVEAGRDHAPDLAVYVPTRINNSEEPQLSVGTEARKSKELQNGSPILKAAKPKGDFASVKGLAMQIRNLVTDIVASELKTEEDVRCNTVAAIGRQLGPELEHLLTMFKNAAYTEGYVAHCGRDIS